MWRIIREGIIAELQEVHIFAGKGGLNFQSPPKGVQEIPGELEWNLWLAQVAARDYHNEWINRVAWRDTSLGTLGNAAPHFANLAFLATDATALWDHARADGAAPIRVTAECSNVNHLSYPRWEKVRWDIPAHGKQPAFSLTWHCGFAEPDYPGANEVLNEIPVSFGTSRAVLAESLKAGPNLFVGSKGLLATNGKSTKIALYPQDKFAGVEQRRPQTLPTSPGHYAEWVAACQGKDVRPMSNFEFAAPFAEFLAVGSLATRFPGEQLEFDPISGQITNHDRAAEFLSCDYRDGWTANGPSAS